MKEFLKNHIIFIVLLAIYFAVNLAFLFIHPGTIFNQPERFGEAISTYGSRDASLYAKMAYQLLNDGVYGYNFEGSNAYVTYGQPLYLTVIFQFSEWFNTNHVMLYRASNMMLSMGIFVLIYSISLKLFKNKWIGLLAVAFYATHIGPLHYFRAALTEIPSMFLLMFTIWLFIIAYQKKQYRYHIIFGIVASLLLMFRATPAPMLLFAWFLILHQVGFKEGVKIGFIWCIGPLLVMGPWVARNFMVFGEAYLFSSHSGGPLLGGANPFYLTPQDELVREAIDAGYSDKEYGQKLILEGFRNDLPLWLSWFTAGKTMWLFFDANASPDGLGPYNSVFSGFWMFFFKIQNLFLVFAGFLSAIAFRKHYPVVLLSSLLLIYIFFSNIFLTIPRYGLLVMPLISIVAAYGIVHTTIMLNNKFRNISKESH